MTGLSEVASFQRRHPESRQSRVTTLTYVVGADKHVVEAPGEGELTIIAAPDVWERLAGGELDVAVAYMQGKVVVE